MPLMLVLAVLVLVVALVAVAAAPCVCVCGGRRRLKVREARVSFCFDGGQELKERKGWRIIYACVYMDESVSEQVYR